MPAMLLEAFCIAQSRLWMPPNGSLHGIAVDRLMRWNLVAICICFFAAHVWLIAAMLRRRRLDHTPRSDAFRWTLLTALCAMYIWMAVTAQHLWASSRYAGPPLEAMQVEVVGEQFQWYFRYPGSDAAFGTTRPALASAAAGNPLGLDARDSRGSDDIVSSALVLPTGREVDLRLRSLDVIHGLFIPGMRIKENTVPGLVLHVHFTPTTPGTYPILCSQVCGLGHARMQAVLSVVSPAEFDSWIAVRERARAKESGPTDQTAP
jgi:cytochrome c oxidase subunit II